MKTTFHICKRNVDLVAKPWKPHAHLSGEGKCTPYKVTFPKRFGDVLFEQFLLVDG